MNTMVTSSVFIRSAVDFLRNYGAIIGMLLVLVLFYLLKPAFLSPANIANVLRQSTVLIILAIGLTVVMSMRGVDLSVAQVADAAGLIAALLIIHHYPVWMAYLLPLCFGLCIGLINAALMGYVGVPAIIGTLGMMFIIRSGELMMTNGAEPQMLFTLPRGMTKPFLFLGQGMIGPFSALIVMTIIVLIVTFVLMRYTPFARQAKAVGLNVRAAFLAGIDIRRIFGAGFVVASLLAAIAGVALVSRTGIAVPRGAEPYLLDAFAAAYLGTLASRRGEMNILGTILGALFIAFLGNGLTLLGLGAPYRLALNGAFILLAMAVGGLKRQH
ncbi:ABC transporter permease [Brucella pecoris]|uniref:ABC transporter permease n=1 Tax=Brucella pecoris TaxID=867683 RepID=A0A5C5CD27_9HYPH|nr:ABC transporter permease [Brucella pecoris]MBB4096262.1 ribose/xylose/arabinose/galactoside ABC-type transport system permease subunit [Brucella pecoris]TNV08696.1 ABC transporter permease [Brucella pecoris]